MRNETRSLNEGLTEGTVEGKYKDTRKGWDGVVEPSTERARMHLDPNKYDIREAHPKVDPFGRVVNPQPY